MASKLAARGALLGLCRRPGPSALVAGRVSLRARWGLSPAGCRSECQELPQEAPLLTVMCTGGVLFDNAALILKAVTTNRPWKTSSAGQPPIQNKRFTREPKMLVHGQCWEACILPALPLASRPFWSHATRFPGTSGVLR